MSRGNVVNHFVFKSLLCLVVRLSLLDCLILQFQVCFEDVDQHFTWSTDNDKLSHDVRSVTSCLDFSSFVSFIPFLEKFFFNTSQNTTFWSDLLWHLSPSAGEFDSGDARLLIHTVMDRVFHLSGISHSSRHKEICLLWRDKTRSTENTYIWDWKLQLRDLHPSHTLGCSGDWNIERSI